MRIEDDLAQMIQKLTEHLDCIRGHVKAGDLWNTAAHLATMSAGCFAMGEGIVVDLLEWDRVETLLEQITVSEVIGEASEGARLMVETWVESKQNADD